MAPKKKQQTQTLSLGAFLNEDKFGGSWADEVEESYGSQPLPAPARAGYSGYGGGGGFGDRGGGAYAPRDSFPTELPTRPPYTAHLGNLSYEATQEAVTDFFADCAITSVRIIEDRIENRPKGFAYAEFADLDGLKRALDLDSEQFQGRNIRVRIADPPKGGEFRDGPSARDLGSWERKGPLADAPGRSNDRRNDFSERRGPPRDGPSDEGRSRDFGNWERRGPLSPAMASDAGDNSRDDSRPRGSDRGEQFRNTRTAAWGEPRPEGSQQQPAREFRERTERPERPERAPTAAEMDNKWRNNMKPDQAPPSMSREGSHGPKSPSGSDPAAPAARPRLNLQKRTVTEAAADDSSAAGSESKASPFGAARPIDTAAKEREIEEKRVQEAKEQKEAEEKAKEERRLAKEAAAEEAEEKAAAEAKEAEEKVAAPPQTEAEGTAEGTKESTAEGKTQDVPVRPKEEAPKSKAAGSGNWRSSGAEPRPARGGYVARGRGDGGRGEGGRGEGGRGDGTRGRGGAGRGGAPRNFEARSPRANGSAPAAGAQDVPLSPAAAPDAEAAPSQDPDGWTTVSKPRRK